MSDTNDLIDFIEEFSSKALLAIGGIKAELKETKPDTEIFSRIFRELHSIKAHAGFFGFNQLVTIAHKCETLIDLSRANQLNSNDEIIKTLRLAIDKIEAILIVISDTHKEGEHDCSKLIEMLDNLSTTLPDKND
jgi:two-component system, chemotaxis family, sensor kinase CheA